MSFFSPPKPPKPSLPATPPKEDRPENATETLLRRRRALLAQSAAGRPFGTGSIATSGLKGTLG